MVMAKITIESLGRKMDEKFDNFAVMVLNGFRELENNLIEKIKEVRSDVAILKIDMSEVKNKLNTIEINTGGHESRISVLESKVKQIAEELGFISKNKRHSS